MNILITGASGGIGSSIKDALSRKEFMIFSPSSKELDLKDKKQITHYLNDKLIDGVVHAAGINSVMHASEVDENILIDHLRINTLSLFQICKNIKSESKCINIIAISSLYGICWKASLAHSDFTILYSAVAQLFRKKTRTSKMNFMFPDISSSIIWKDQVILC